MKKNKNYKEISSREAQRNPSALRDALATNDIVYLTYYNKRIGKVTPIQKHKKKKEKSYKEILEDVSGICAKRGKEIEGKSYDEVYREELMKKYGHDIR